MIDSHPLPSAMTITLTTKEETELWTEAVQTNPSDSTAASFECCCQVPKQLGHGCIRDIEVHPGLWLALYDYQYQDDVQVHTPTWDHLVQFGALLSGTIADQNGQAWGRGHTLIAGSGVQPAMTFTIPKASPLVGVDIELSPELLATFFPSADGDLLPELSLLVRNNDWQTLLYPETSLPIQQVVQQIVTCPFEGITRRMYLQAKVLEFLALQLAPILSDQKTSSLPPRLRAGTIAQLHHAKELLLNQIENPPSLLELAQKVGMSDRTLRRGFRELFGTTVFGYLTDRRMERAEQWLRQCDRTIAEVSAMTGYSNPGHFAAAFKRKFGITPSECMMGKKSV